MLNNILTLSLQSCFWFIIAEMSVLDVNFWVIVFVLRYGVFQPMAGEVDNVVLKKCMPLFFLGLRYNRTITKIQ